MGVDQRLDHHVLTVHGGAINDGEIAAAQRLAERDAVLGRQQFLDHRGQPIALGIGHAGELAGFDDQLLANGLDRVPALARAEKLQRLIDRPGGLQRRELGPVVELVGKRHPVNFQAAALMLREDSGQLDRVDVRRVEEIVGDQQQSGAGRGELPLDMRMPVLSGGDVLIRPDIEAIAQRGCQLIPEALKPRQVLVRVADEDAAADQRCRLWCR
jgi:hypothetical protein